MASNYGSPIQSPNPADRMTAGQQAVNYAQKAANAKVFGNPKVSNTIGQRANAIENGMPVKQAWKTFADPEFQSKYHQ